jgi:hypothetical protein
MSINKFNKNIISNLNIDNIYSVLPSVDSNDFYFVIPTFVNRSKSLSRFQIICQNQESFRGSFSNMFFNNTLDYKSYSNNQNLDMLGNNISKNIFLNYNKKKSSRSNDFFEEVLFNTSHYVYDQDQPGYEANPNLYNIILPVSLSKKLVNYNIQNIRIIAVDDKNIVLDKTDVQLANFNVIKLENQKIDTQLFYKNYFLNRFINTTSIKLNKENSQIIISASSEINNTVFKEVDINLSYSNGTKSILSENSGIDTRNYPFIVTNEINSFSFKIAKDAINEEIENFNIMLNIKFYFSDTSEINSEGSNFISLNKSFVLSKNDLFIRNCVIKNQKKLFGEVMKSLRFKQDYKLNNSKLEIKLSVTNRTKDNMLKKIVIKDIKKNNVSLNNLYTSSDLTLENKLSYKGKSLFDLFTSSNNFNIFYCQASSRENKISVILSFLNKDIKYDSKKIISKEDYSSNIEKANKLFKRNIQISNVDLNTSLSLANKSIFNYRKIYLSNINKFNDIAYSFGYTTNDKSDVVAFLENSLVKIENTTLVNEIDVISNKSNYYFFNEVFNTNDISSNIIEIRDEYLKSHIETDDYFQIIRTKNTSINKNIIRFLTSADSENSFKHILKEESLNLENKLSIKVLPLPKVIANFRGYGLDSKNNPINIDLYDDIVNITSIKNRLTRELVMFLYSGNSNLNWTQFNKYKKLLFKQELTEDSLNYSEFFDNIINLNVQDYNVFTNTAEYDRNEILSLINTDDIFINSNIHTDFAEENLGLNYFNFSLCNREIFCSSLPYSIVFKNVNYLSNTDEYEPKEIIFLRNSNNIQIDISYLENFYEKSSLLNIEPIIRTSLHIMNSNYNNDIDINVENTDFLLANISGKSCLTYNKKHINENRAVYSNFNDSIDNSLITINSSGNKVYVDININNNYIDLNKMKYENFIPLFEYSKTNNINYIEKVLIRFSMSFDIPDSEDSITAIFHKEIPYMNLNNKKISLNNTDKIDNVIVTE